MKVRNPKGIGKIKKQFVEIREINTIVGGKDNAGIFMEIKFKDKSALLIMPSIILAGMRKGEKEREAINCPFEMDIIINLIKQHLGHK